jgi:hypothetical protein
MINLMKSLKRVNLKLDLTFWAIKPYREVMNYVIDNVTYKPVSYRFLCFALIIVTKGDVVNYTFDSDLKRVLQK